MTPSEGSARPRWRSALTARARLRECDGSGVNSRRPTATDAAATSRAFGSAGRGRPLAATATPIRTGVCSAKAPKALRVTAGPIPGSERSRCRCARSTEGGQQRCRQREDQQHADEPQRAGVQGPLPRSDELVPVRRGSRARRMHPVHHQRLENENADREGRAEPPEPLPHIGSGAPPGQRRWSEQTGDEERRRREHQRRRREQCHQHDLGGPSEGDLLISAYGQKSRSEYPAIAWPAITAMITSTSRLSSAQWRAERVR